MLMTTQVEDHYCTPSELREVMSHLQNQSIYFMAGANTLYVPAGKRRYIDKTVCKPWLDLDNYHRLMTPGQAARTELTREWPLLKKVGWPGKSVSLLDWRSPIYFSGPQIGQMIYIDLDGAYSQIYEKLWLDTRYPRGYYGSYPLEGVAQRLKIWKSARNSLIGITRSREGVAYRGLKRIRLKVKNRYLSPGLWATVQTLLHWIMNQAIECGAIYGNVDGYIFPLGEWEFIEEFTEWLSDREIRWSIRGQGAGEIVSWNNYRIGSLATKAHKLKLTHKSKEFNSVNITNPEVWDRYWTNLRKIQGRAGGDDSRSTSTKSDLRQANARNGSVSQSD